MFGLCVCIVSYLFSHFQLFFHFQQGQLAEILDQPVSGCLLLNIFYLILLLNLNSVKTATYPLKTVGKECPDHDDKNMQNG